MCERLGKKILENLKSQVIWSEVITVERSLEKDFEERDQQGEEKSKNQTKDNFSSQQQ